MASLRQQKRNYDTRPQESGDQKQKTRTHEQPDDIIGDEQNLLVRTRVQTINTRTQTNSVFAIYQILLGRKSVLAIYQILLGWKTRQYQYETHELINPKPNPTQEK